MMNEKCENCKFYASLELYKRDLKILRGSGVISGVSIDKSKTQFEYSNCCLAMPLIAKEMRVLEVYPYDVCEMFQVKNHEGVCDDLS